VFSAVVAGLTVLFQWLCPNYASPALPFIVLFFCIITLFTIYIVLRDEKGKAQNRFISNYYLSRIIKIFSCLIFLIAYMLLNKPDALRFAIAFLVVYFMYSIFEVVVLKKEMSDMGKPTIEESEQKTE
jgi:predicted neutral ceramidase superfamily lipid hydrolase